MKNKKEIILLIPITIILASIILNNYLGDLDEIWNYNFARNIVEGRIPYKDFNMLLMPLLPIINSLFLFILGNQLIVMRLIAIILCSSIIFLIYKILKRLEISSEVNLLILIGIVYLFKEHFRIDYNFATIFLILTIIYKEIKNDTEILKCNLKHDILIGLLAGITIIFKQTIGLVLCALAVGYKLLIVKNKKQLKEYIKIALLRLLGISIPIFIFVIYISILGIWKDFIDYTILGIKTFSNTIPYTNLIKNGKLIIVLLSLILPINTVFQYIYSNIIYRKTGQKANLIILSAYSIGTFVIAFPISDEIHFLLAIIPSIILICYLIYQKTIKIMQEKQKLFCKSFLHFFTIWTIITFTVLSMYSLISYINFNVIKNNNDLEHFKYIPIKDNLKNQIKEIDKYIENNSKEVLILDATAGIYMIPINKYHKDYDLFLKGNLGFKNEEGIIENLEKIEDVTLLIMNDNNHRNWQNPEKVRKYIKENWNKVGYIACFDIYEK